MSAYGSFAEIYDALMDDFDYPQWAEYYLMILRKAGCDPSSMCDCACGTGSLTIQFARKGKRVIGVDLSNEMLRIAGDRSRRCGQRIQFVCQNMKELMLPRPVDAIVCGCDGVNYLLTDRDTALFFKKAYASLRPGGVLAFDISSEHKLKNILGNAFFGEEREQTAYLWGNTWNDENRCVNMDITFFVKEENGLYRRFREEHIQRAYDVETITALLEKSGFQDIRVYGDCTLETPGPEEKRIHFTAMRN